MKDKLHFADRLSEVMFRRAEMSAFQLSKEVGVSHVTIGNYLVGQPPKSVLLISIAKFFGVSTDWLLGLVGESMYDEKGGIRDSAGPMRIGDGNVPYILPNPGLDQKIISSLRVKARNIQMELDEMKILLVDQPGTKINSRVEAAHEKILGLGGESGASYHQSASKKSATGKHPAPVSDAKP